ncbi:MAG: hypothetical protein NTV94_09745 [Planctomycetota bacterium]|nr:hypothetical protein [Planctomycetota bacterium]
MTTSVNIVEHFARKLAAHNAIVTESQKARAQVQLKLDALPARRDSIRATRAEKISAKAVLETHRLDTSQIREQIAAIDAEEEAIQNAEVALTRELASVEASGRSVDLETLLRLAEVLATKGVTDAEVVATIDECRSYVQLASVNFDTCGMPTSCKVCAGSGFEFEMPIVACRARSLLNVAPEKYVWLPPCRAAARGEVEQPRCLSMAASSHTLQRTSWLPRKAWILAGSDQLVVSTGANLLLEMHLKKLPAAIEAAHATVPNLPNRFARIAHGAMIGPRGEGLRYTEGQYRVLEEEHEKAKAARTAAIGREIEESTTAAGRLLVALDVDVCEKIDASDRLIDLEKDYSNDALRGAVQAKVLELTTEKPLFRLDGLELTSKNTYEKIKIEWLAFVEAPWSSALEGSHAKLKYICEGGERPRFWCDGYANCYGFIVRTRDHTWIRGRIFIDDCEPQPKSSLQIEVHFKKDSHWAMKVGHMYFTAFEVRDQ